MSNLEQFRADAARTFAAGRAKPTRNFYGRNGGKQVCVVGAAYLAHHEQAAPGVEMCEWTRDHYKLSMETISGVINGWDSDALPGGLRDAIRPGKHCVNPDYAKGFRAGAELAKEFVV